jgi:hypothetical protein
MPKSTVAPIVPRQLAAKPTLNQIEDWSNPRLDNKMESLAFHVYSLFPVLSTLANVPNLVHHGTFGLSFHRERIMKRIAVFLVGIGLLGFAAWWANPRTEPFASVIVARLLIERPGLDAGEQKQLLADESLVILSPKVLRGAISRGQLARLPSLKDKDVAKTLGDGLTAAPWQVGQRILEIHFRAKAEADGVAVLRAVVDAYLELSAQESTDTQRTLRDTIEQLSKQCVVTLEAQTKQRAELVLSSRFAPLDDYSEILDEQAKDIAARTRALTEKEVVAATLRARLEVLDEALKHQDDQEIFSLFILNDPQARVATGAAEIVVKLLPLFQKKSQLLKNVGPDHPDVVKVRGEIAAAREFLGKDPVGDEETLWDFVKSYVEALRLQKQMVEREVAALETKFRADQDELREYSRFAVRERQLSDAIATTKRQFDVLVNKIEQIRIAFPLEVKLVEPAKPLRELAGSESGNLPWMLGLSLGLVAAGALLWSWQPRNPESDIPTIGFPFHSDLNLLDELVSDHRSLAVDQAIQQISAVVRLAKFGEGRNYFVILGDRAEVPGIGLHVAAELAQQGCRVQLLGGDSAHGASLLAAGQSLALTKHWGDRLSIRELGDTNSQREFDYCLVVGLAQSMINEYLDPLNVVELHVGDTHQRLIHQDMIQLESLCDVDPATVVSG